MSENQFEEISCFLHLNDSTLQPQRGEDGYDHLYKVRLILKNFNNKIRQVYHPKKNISVDEGMIAFKGIAFQQYMPAKPVKYGIKVWLAVDASNVLECRKLECRKWHFWDSKFQNLLGCMRSKSPRRFPRLLSTRISSQIHQWPVCPNYLLIWHWHYTVVQL